MKAFCRNYFRKALFLFLICSQAIIFPIVLIFDMGGVLLQTSSFKVAREIGLVDLTIHSLFNRHPQKTFFEFLTKAFGEQQPVNPQSPEEAWLYAMGHGMPLPQIWCDHMKGLLSGPQVIERVHGAVAAHPCSEREKRIIKKFVKTVFDPVTLTAYQKPIPEGVRLLNDCAARPDNTIMILSNFSADGFYELFKKEEMRPIFKNIRRTDHLMVSGYMGLMKPDPAIYTEVKRRLIAHDVRFKDPIYLIMNAIIIDDQIENILAARQAGFTALLDDGDHEKLRDDLAILGAL